MFTKVFLLYFWGNSLYFAYHFISKNQNLDDFISFFGEVYSFDWANSLGIVGGFIQLGLSILFIISMGLSIVVLLRFFWKFLTTKIDLDKDFD
tara:strand:+ start:1179 stop:1457 length:279 start_codon:yes stop_codon:yes gene_type:complete